VNTDTTAAPRPQQPAADTAWYVYGVVPATAPQPTDTVGVGSPPAPVELVRHGRIAALVSEVDSAAPLGTPDDLRAHAHVLDSMAADSTPVLPFRFGGVVRDRQAVADELLGPRESSLVAAFDELGDLVQFTVRGSYRQDRMLREILQERPDIARLRERIKDVPPQAALDEQVRLGELVSQEIAIRRQEDGRVLVDELAPLATAAVNGVPSDEQAVDASFLVHPAERGGFEAAAEDLARAWAERIDLRLLGPLAPYDFAAALVEHTERTS
jgi:hypothetical protein